MTTVILGAGLIGTSTAYYLSHSQAPSSIHLVELSPKLFASASGYAAGFLAKDWFSPSVAALGVLSFEEHRKLSAKYDGRGRWGYSTSTGTNYTAGQGKTMNESRGDEWLRYGSSRAEAAAVGTAKIEDETTPSWLRRVDGDSVEVIGEEGTTAQVDPLRLSQFLLSQCLDRGVQLHHPAKAIYVTKDIHDELSGVRIISTESAHKLDIPCTRLVITAGAWSPQVFNTLFPAAKIKLPISSLAGYSLILRSPHWNEDEDVRGCHAVFTTDEAGYSPEIFSRVGGEIYIAGLNSSSLPLPALATETEIDEHAIEKLKETARRLLDIQGDVESLQVVRKGLCFRPITDSGPPIISRIPDWSLGEGIRTRGGADGGVFLAAGHGPWGISLSLGTGKVMAEMLQGLPASADVSALRL